MSRTHLHTAAVLGNYSEIKWMLANNNNNRFNVNAKDPKGRTALDLARQRGYRSIANLLLEYGAEPGITDNGSILNLPMEGSRLELFKYFLKYGFDVNSPHDSISSLPLHKACEVGNKSAVNYLLERYHNHINKRDFYNRTPIFLAINNGHEEIVKYLILYGADLNVKDTERLTPLHLAAKLGHLNVVKLLVENGATYDFRQVYNHSTPLNLAVLLGRTDVVRYFLDLGASVDTQTEEGHTLLHLAAHLGYTSTVKMLLDRKASVNSRIYANLNTPLHFATQHTAWPEIIELLIMRGADLKAIDECGNTPLNNILRNDPINAKIIKSAEHLIKYTLLNDKNTHIRNDAHEMYLTLHLECLRDVELMDRYFIGDTTITLYKFLQDMFHEIKLATYLRNPDINREMARPSKHLKNFPNYSNFEPVVLAGMMRASQWQCLTDKAIEYIDPKIPLDVRMKIFTYLDRIDIEVFITALDSPFV